MVRGPATRDPRANASPSTFEEPATPGCEPAALADTSRAPRNRRGDLRRGGGIGVGPGGHRSARSSRLSTSTPGSTCRSRNGRPPAAEHLRLKTRRRRAPRHRRGTRRRGGGLRGEIPRHRSARSSRSSTSTPGSTCRSPKAQPARRRTLAPTQPPAAQIPGDGARGACALAKHRALAGMSGDRRRVTHHAAVDAGPRIFRRLPLAPTVGRRFGTPSNAPASARRCAPAPRRKLLGDMPQPGEVRAGAHGTSSGGATSAAAARRMPVFVRRHSESTTRVAGASPALAPGGPDMVRGPATRDCRADASPSTFEEPCDAGLRAGGLGRHSPSAASSTR
jgi:hypothetical protein